jgi:uncharacterized protein (DUF362 family)/Pyruvate/2-oxoacid:ferredoxin oxidoreductase delta subunit
MTTDSAHTDEFAKPSRVALVRCDRYDDAAVQAAVDRGLDLIGGADRFCRPGEKLVLKPNLLVASAPDKAVTTHPAVFCAVARAFQATGVELSYGDSPGFEMLPGGAAQRSGITAAADDLNIPMADFAAGETISFPEGKLIKQFNLARGVLEADGLISLPKLKTHGLTRLTGAIKNQFGCIPGLLKPEFHVRLSDLQRFSQMLIDLNRLLRPRLAVMDGIVAMEGNGPRGGTPRPMSVLLFSDDLVALDAVVCQLVNLDPEMVAPIVWGQEWGLGNAQEIELLGDPIESFVTPDFDVNRRRGSTTGSPWPIPRPIKNWIVPRPTIVPENCTRCGTCVQVCPVTPKAIDFREPNGRKAPPSYNYRQCIRCYCCQEMCPEHAIEIETPLLGRLIHR